MIMGKNKKYFQKDEHWELKSKELAYDPEIPLLDRYTKKLKAESQRDTVHHCS